MNNSSIKRILVALDASAANRSALQTAALLANQLQAELQALFVEDINLLHLAELPFAREMMFGSRDSRQITLATMERQIQAQASQLRQLVAATAQQNQIKVDFRILRGQISNELLLASQQMDLLILGKNTQLLQQSVKLGRVAQEVLAAVNCNVLLLQHGTPIERPVAVLFDGSEASQRALQLAMQLAHGDHDQLKVIFPATEVRHQERLQQQVKDSTQTQNIDAGHIQLPINSTDALLQAVQTAHSRVLVVESGSDVFNSQAIKSLIQQSNIPVIIMR
jgi:nucleotide-binding universal stress UspA family protein